MSNMIANMWSFYFGRGGWKSPMLSKHQQRAELLFPAHVLEHSDCGAMPHSDYTTCFKVPFFRCKEMSPLQIPLFFLANRALSSLRALNQPTGRLLRTGIEAPLENTLFNASNILNRAAAFLDETGQAAQRAHILAAKAQFPATRRTSKSASFSTFGARCKSCT